MITRITVLAALLVLSSPAMAQGVEIGPGGVEVRPYVRGADCHELRAACLHKEELGEEGQGNCQRYRELCSAHHHHYQNYQ